MIYFSKKGEIYMQEQITTTKRSYILTLLLSLFLGWLGIHRFYTGYIWIGLIQLVTAGGFGIWQLIDVIAIIFNNYQDSDGQDLEGYNAGCGMIVFVIIIAAFIVGGLGAALKFLSFMH